MVKAVRFSRFGGPEVLQIVDLPDPHPGPGQVRIAVRAAGVSPGATCMVLMPQHHRQELTAASRHRSRHLRSHGY